jgi:Reverse transcriptase (RNA-dependent DNA polymerase)
LAQSLGDRIQGIELVDVYEDVNKHQPYEDDVEEPRQTVEADDFDIDANHKFIASKVMLPQGGQAVTGRVIRRKRDADGNLIGKSHPNPLLDTSLFEVEFDDGHIEAYTANLIAESIYEQIDSEGNIHRMMDEIIDHKRMNDALHVDDLKTYNGKQRQTTKGWRLCVRWKDGSLTWEKLALLKEGYPIEVAEYAVANKLITEPAFSWWAPNVLRKRDRITRYLRREEKFGIAIPKTVREALEIDNDTGTTYWTDAIRKEMSVIMPAMKILEQDAKPPIGFQEIPCHIVFDVKIDFTRKARYVGGGHVTKPPATQTYACVVSRESVRITFLYASLNNLKIMSADVQGAYLNAPCKEKVYTRCGPEFGPENIGKNAVVVKALYGIKTSAFAWREHLSHTLESSLEFSHCLADNDVWMRPATTSEGRDYYQYILVHTDDILVVAEKPLEILNLLDQHYVLKPGSIGEPKSYLVPRGENQLLQITPDIWSDFFCFLTTYHDDNGGDAGNHNFVTICQKKYKHLSKHTNQPERKTHLKSKY